MIPHLETAPAGAMNDLESYILESRPVIERWFRMEWMEHTPPLYASIPVRHNGLKIAAIDCDLFPMDFGRLSPQVMPLAIQAAMSGVERSCPEARSALIIPSHHRHSDYLAHLAQLRNLYHRVGLNVRIGSIDRHLTQPETWDLPDGDTLIIEPLQRHGDKLVLDHFDPCFLILNDNLSEGIPGILEELSGQLLRPELPATTPLRTRSAWIKSYDDVAKRLAKTLSIDPWLIAPYAESVVLHPIKSVNATSTFHWDAIQDQAHELLQKIKRKHKEYGSSAPASIRLWPDRLHGQGPSLTFTDARCLHSNHPAMKRLLETCETRGLQHHTPEGCIFVLQEGLPSSERWEQHIAEPSVLCLYQYVIGGYYALHPHPTPPLTEATYHLPDWDTPSLPMGLERTSVPTLHQSEKTTIPNRFYVSSVVARMALLAASIQLESYETATV